MKTFLYRWGPALLVMAVIFTASSFSKAGLPQFGTWDWAVKKAGHMLGYGLLGVFYLRGLAPGVQPTIWQIIFAVALTGLYGATDEFHQSFVAGRGALPSDVLIDLVGATMGVAVRVWVGN